MFITIILSSYMHYKDPGASLKNHEIALDIFKIFIISLSS